MPQNTQTIRIKVPNQEFESILLVVGPGTTLRHVIQEVSSQLEGAPNHFIVYESKHRSTIRALPFDDNTEPVYFMRDWLMYEILNTGAKEFEYIYTDLIQ